MRVGVLALQGDFAEHLRILGLIGADAFEVRSDSDVRAADAMVFPGGESTTILKLADRFELREPLKKRIEGGMPVFGTCAGAIILSGASRDGEKPLDVVPISVVRNAYGPQVESFETTIDIDGIGPDVRAAFIRAPKIDHVGLDVEVMGRYEGDPVIARYNNVLVTTFHPEIVGETRVHRWFLSEMC